MGFLNRSAAGNAVGRATVSAVALLVFLIPVQFLLFPAGAAAAPRENVREETARLAGMGLGERDAVEMAEAMEKGKFDDPSRVKVREMVRESLARGIPLSPLIGKMNEGTAKGVGAREIVRAMDRVRSRYGFAFGETGKMGFPGAETGRLAEIVAAGLAAGMTEKDMTAVLGALPGKAAAGKSGDRFRVTEETVLVARDMARFGVSSPVVAETVLGALVQGYTVTELEALRDAFVDRARYESPEGIARSYGEAIGRGVRGGQLGSGASSGGGGGSGSGDAGGGSGSGSSGGDSGSGGSGGGSGSGSSGGDSGSGGSGGDSGSGSSGGDSGSGGSGGDSGSGGSGGDSGSGGSGGDSGSGSSGGDAGSSGSSGGSGSGSSGGGSGSGGSGSGSGSGSSGGGSGSGGAGGSI